MVYDEKPYWKLKLMIWGYHYFWKHPLLIHRFWPLILSLIPWLEDDTEKSCLALLSKCLVKLKLKVCHLQKWFIPISEAGSAACFRINNQGLFCCSPEEIPSNWWLNSGWFTMEVKIDLQPIPAWEEFIHSTPHSLYFRCPNKWQRQKHTHWHSLHIHICHERIFHPDWLYISIQYPPP